MNATFTPDGLLLFDTTGGARLYDVATGRLLRTVLPAVDPQRFHHFGFEASRHVLALPNPQYKGGGVATAALYDGTGDPIAEFPRLGEEDQRVVVSRTSPTVVYEDHLESTTRLMVRDLTVPGPSMPLIERPDSRYAMAFANVIFSPSGERAMIIYWTPEQFLADVVDVKSRKRIGRLFEASGGGKAYEGRFGGSDYVWVGLTDLWQPPTYHVAPVGGEWHRRIRGVRPDFPSMRRSFLMTGNCWRRRTPDSAKWTSVKRLPAT